MAIVTFKLAHLFINAFSYDGATQQYFKLVSRHTNAQCCKSTQHILNYWFLFSPSESHFVPLPEDGGKKKHFWLQH